MFSFGWEPTEGAPRHPARVDPRRGHARRRRRRHDPDAAPHRHPRRRRRRARRRLGALPAAARRRSHGAPRRDEPSMKIPKPTDADRDRFHSLVPDAPGVETKPMFGNLGAFVNGNMFMGLFGSDIGIKLARRRPSRAPRRARRRTVRARASDRWAATSRSRRNGRRARPAPWIAQALAAAAALPKPKPAEDGGEEGRDDRRRHHRDRHRPPRRRGLRVRDRSVERTGVVREHRVGRMEDRAAAASRLEGRVRRAVPRPTPRVHLRARRARPGGTARDAHRGGTVPDGDHLHLGRRSTPAARA